MLYFRTYGDVRVGVGRTDLLFYAAKEAGAGRFIYISSLNVYSVHYPRVGEFIRDSDETLANGHYGTIKWLAEGLCRYYALRKGVSSSGAEAKQRDRSQDLVAQGRDLGREDSPNGSHVSRDYACTRVHIDDVVRAIRFALEKEILLWGRCLISGANLEKHYDTGIAEELIGFRARYGFSVGKMYRDGVEMDRTNGG